MARREVDLVLLGDAGVGKTSLAKRFVGESFDRASQPTVGAEGWTTQLTLSDGTECDVMLWDYAGQERFVRLSGGGLRGADGCLLVFDLLTRESFEHVNLWHDEFLQNSASATARDPPLFVLLGNKLDEVEAEEDPEEEERERVTVDEEAMQRREEAAKQRRERRRVTQDEAHSWCADEKVDAATSDDLGRGLPYWEVSAIRADVVRAAFVDAVERAVRRQKRIEERIAQADGQAEDRAPAVEDLESVSPSAGSGAQAASALRRASSERGDEDESDDGVHTSRWLGRASSVVDVRAVIVGDMCVGKTCFVTQCTQGRFDDRYNPSQKPLRGNLKFANIFEEKGVRLSLCDVPGKEKGVSWECMRGAHVCCIAVASNSRKSLERAPLWKEVFMRETGLRCDKSALFVLLFTKADLDGPLIDVPSTQAREWAAVHDMEFVACDSTERSKSEETVRKLALLALKSRIECIAERVEAQLVSAEQASRAAKEQQSQRLKQDRAQLSEARCPPPPPQVYADGKVWSGARKGEDTFVDCPVYSFPVKDLQGKPMRAGNSDWQTHLPLLLGKIQDLQNDMAKQEQRHKEEMEILRRANLMETSSLRREIEDHRAELEKERQKHDDLRWELRLVWQTLESR
eukprot:TRINITY_DN14735_c0_g1_i2.p1 TRINITY_DN14735_c0_g1~~TRINITY_DN14735_c0_g1_i2.p1  ORF type:complete len:632 (+),score=155.20 TRINITY_DN14735_c0_g1_i2:49-1944(+)